jgi:Ca-activated chloride channel family protein
MQPKYRIALLILLLAGVSSLALSHSWSDAKSVQPEPVAPDSKPIAANGGLSLEAKLVQDKILVNGDGVLSLAVTLRAAPAAESARPNRPRQNVDLVVVLDRSGSMHGQKINDSRRAVIELLSALDPNDRFSLITYADASTIDIPLTAVDERTRGELMAKAAAVQPGGNTNLASGLQAAFDMLRNNRSANRNGKILLISDGMANRGVVEPDAIAAIAAAAVNQDFGVSSLGVGADFNELLMTRIADKGAGAYYFLEDPQRIAGVFLKESQETRTAAARNIEIRIPLPEGVVALDASGYPIETQGRLALFRAGDLAPGATRTIHVALRAPTSSARSFEIKGVSASFSANGQPHGLTLDAPLRFACAPDPKAVAQSIDKKLWERKTLQDDLGKLKEEVAQELRSGDEKGALRKIEQYKAQKAAENTSVGSDAVRQSLERDMDKLATTVKDTFSASPAAPGAPAMTQEKQNRNAKMLQHESYTQRRDKS